MQNKHQFDYDTFKHIVKGALIASTGAGALYLLRWLGSLNIGSWTPLIAAGVPILTNMVREWLKGE